MDNSYPPKVRREGCIATTLVYKCAWCRKYAARKIGNDHYQCRNCGSVIQYVVKRGVFGGIKGGTISVSNHPIRHGRNPLPTETKNAVLRRDHYRCRYCNKPVGKGEYEFDHIFPYSRGGGNTANNLVVACKTCNRSKGARTPEEARMTIRYR